MLDGLFVWLSRIGTFGLVWIMIGLAISLVQRRPLPVLLVTAAALLGDLVTSFAKLTIDRTRPHYHPAIPVPTSHSFPSGHAASSFAAATVIGVLVPRLRVPAFVLAAAIAFSRVYNGVHWPTDVLVGAVTGVLIALLLLAAVRRAPRRDSRSG